MDEKDVEGGGHVPIVSDKSSGKSINYLRMPWILPMFFLNSWFCQIKGQPLRRAFEQDMVGLYLWSSPCTTWIGFLPLWVPAILLDATVSVTKLFAIQAGLFSASITAFILESYKNLKPDSSDMMVTLLTQISQQLSANANGSPIDILAQTDSFQPTSSTLRVNAFWFLSLCFSLTCALAATLVEEWTRHYLQAIERRPAPYSKGEQISRD